MLIFNLSRGVLVFILTKQILGLGDLLCEKQEYNTNKCDKCLLDTVPSQNNSMCVSDC
jgi:hypothetical protein